MSGVAVTPGGRPWIATPSPKLSEPAVKPIRKPRRPDPGSAKEPEDLLEQDI